MSILVTGSIAYDILLGYEGSFADGIDPAALDRLSVSFFTPRHARHHGGTGANIAWNLALLGGEPLLVGDVGADGAEYLALLRSRNIDTAHVRTHRDLVTATAIIGTDAAERQIAFFHPGADSAGAWQGPSDISGVTHAIISPRDGAKMLAAARWCHAQGVPYLFDPGQQSINLGLDDLRRAIAQSAGVIANAYEWSVLSERLGKNEEEILHDASLLIVTRGDEGLSVCTRDGRIDVPACTPARVVNPTGAGDALRAGFLYGLSAGWDLERCAKLGAAMGSLAVEIEGTLLDSLDADEVWLRAGVAREGSVAG